MDVKERYFFLLNQEQIKLLLALLLEYYFDTPEVRELLRTITSQVDTDNIDRDILN